jgi:hypothetical protein
LVGILMGTVYCPLAEKMSPAYTPEKVCKADLTEYLARAMARCKITNKILGWTEETYPDYDWMVTVLYHLWPSHDIFSYKKLVFWKPKT